MYESSADVSEHGWGCEETGVGMVAWFGVGEIEKVCYRAIGRPVSRGEVWLVLAPDAIQTAKF